MCMKKEMSEWVVIIKREHQGRAREKRTEKHCYTANHNEKKPGYPFDGYLVLS